MSHRHFNRIQGVLHAGSVRALSKSKGNIKIIKNTIPFKSAVSDHGLTPLWGI